MSRTSTRSRVKASQPHVCSSIAYMAFSERFSPSQSGSICCLLQTPSKQHLLGSREKRTLVAREQTYCTDTHSCIHTHHKTKQGSIGLSYGWATRNRAVRLRFDFGVHRGVSISMFKIALGAVADIAGGYRAEVLGLYTTCKDQGTIKWQIVFRRSGGGW